ncbi:MAG TPA: DUF1684 domain-containing protein [Acidobacteria bacterium]|nr:DUF1684 domain-containing protein [Acidobacteriota bacterium]
MKRTSSLPRSLVWLLTLSLLPLAASTACKQGAPVDQAFLASENAWRVEREARLKKPDGWLTLVGLYWLEPGENTVGSDPSNRVVLPEAPGVPPHAGVLVLEADGSVHAAFERGSGVLLGDQPATDVRLRTDADPGGPDVLHAGRISFYVIERSGRIGIRVKDPEAPTRTQFKGLQWYPPDPKWRVTGHLERFAQPRKVEISTHIGTTELMLAPGVIHFTLNGAELSLTPLISAPDDTDLFIVFADATSGSETYGAGRFLDATLNPDGTVVLDFNRAYSPPCAFTPHATCPLPPPENVLQIPIRAGEKFSEHH